MTFQLQLSKPKIWRFDSPSMFNALEVISRIPDGSTTEIALWLQRRFMSNVADNLASPTLVWDVHYVKPRGNHGAQHIWFFSGEQILRRKERDRREFDPALHHHTSTREGRSFEAQSSSCSVTPQGSLEIQL